MAHHAGGQVYVSNEGASVLRRLPAEALHGLRYYEVAGVPPDSVFTPYPPLQGAALKAQNFYYVAVTDWSLFVMDRGGSGEGAVLVELPWLGVQDLNCDIADSNVYLEGKGEAFRGSVISISPKVDLNKLPPTLLNKLRDAASKANSGEDRPLIPAGKRLFASSFRPKPQPSPVPPVYESPYTKGNPTPPAPAEIRAASQAWGGGYGQPQQYGPPAYRPAGQYNGVTQEASPGSQWAAAQQQQRQQQLLQQQQQQLQQGQQQQQQRQMHVQHLGTSAVQGSTAQQQYSAQQYNPWLGQQGQRAGAGRPLGEAVEQPGGVGYGHPHQEQVHATDPFRELSGASACAASGHADAAAAGGVTQGPLLTREEQQRRQWAVWQQALRLRQSGAGQQQQQAPWDSAGRQQQPLPPLQQPAQQQQAFPLDPATGLTWVEEQSLRWQQQQQGQQQGRGGAAAGASSSTDPAALVPVVPTYPHQTLAPHGQYVTAFRPEQSVFPPMFPPSQAAPLTWAQEQALAWRQARHEGQLRQQEQRQVQWQEPWSAEQQAQWQYIVPHAPWDAAATTVPPQQQAQQQPAQYAFGALERQRRREAGEAEALRWQLATQQVWQQQQQEQWRQQQQQLLGQQQRQQQGWGDALDVPWVPVELRGPLSPPVPQPGRGEAWHADDDEPPDFSCEDMLGVLPGYAMRFATIEKRSCLALHIRRAWLGAHMRLGLVAAGVPGLPLWYTPPPSPFTLHASAKALTRACKATVKAVRKPGPQGGRQRLDVPEEQPAQQLQFLVYFGHKVLMFPWQQTRQYDPSGVADPFTGTYLLWPPAWPLLQPWPLGPGQSQLLPASLSGRFAAAAGSTPAWHGVPSSPASALVQQQQWQQRRRQALSNPATPSKVPADGILRSPRTAAVAEPHASSSGSNAGSFDPSTAGGVGGLFGPQPLREVWAAWEAGPLAAGGSLFDDGDAELLRELTIEAAASAPGRAHDMAARLFASAPALLFMLQRLYAWGAVCALYGQRDKGGSTGDAAPSDAGSGTGRPAVSSFVRYVLSRNKRAGTVGERDAVDLWTGAVKTADEETYDFFRALYDMSTWMPAGSAQASGAAAPSGLLRRLGLFASSPADLPSTLRTIVTTLEQLRAAAARTATAARGGVRSEPPQPVPAPPTLAPEPLMLSPLRELPYLFAMELPGEAGRVDRLLQQEGSSPEKQKGNKRLAFQQAQEFKQKALLQATHLGQALQSSYTEDYLGFQASDQALNYTKGLALWERLMGRLCARLAWKRVCQMLAWIDSQLAFSEGAESRALWVTGRELHTRGEGRHDMTYENCTRHLMMVCVQLKDPEGWPLARQLRPVSRSDMLAWSRYGAGQYALDWQASILYELRGLSEQGDALGVSATQSLFDQVLLALPVDAANTLARRLFMRLTCLLTGSALLHGFDPPAETSTSPFGAAGAGSEGFGGSWRGAVQEAEDAEAAGGSPRVLAAEVAAFRVADVLATLLQRVPKVALALGEPLSEELLHLVRTPEARARLAARSCNAVLARASLERLDAILSTLRDAEASYPPSAARAGAGSLVAGGGALSTPHLASRAALHTFLMPRMLT